MRKLFPPFVRLLAVIAVLSCDSSLLAQAPAVSGQFSLAQGGPALHRTTAEIMSSISSLAARQHVYLKREMELPGRRDRPQDPNAVVASQFPGQSAPRTSTVPNAASIAPKWPQVVGASFDALTGPNETGSFPPDTMGAVGPAQFIVFANGRIRSFNKASGSADSVLNVNPDDFFANVMTPSKNAALNFTTDPQIRYDRLTKRWILTIIDVPSSSDSTIGDLANRFLIAVSDATSNGVITGNTIWSFYYVQQDMVGGADTGELLDYDSLGVDNNALYIGGNMFAASSGSFHGTAVFVVRKSDVLNPNGSVQPFTTAFRDLLATGDGPDSPRGVDNFDVAANEGYIIGTSDAAFGRLILRRISNPGGVPTISANIPITVNSTSFPVTIPHAGNTAGTNGNLDGLDDRLYAAHIRNGRLWTAHTIAVSAAGISASLDAQRRDAVRWYELNVPAGGGAPVILQSGTVFDSATNASDARQYWVPSVMVSGQGHAALGFSTAGSLARINAGTNGRLSTDALGNLGIPTLFTNSISAYNPAGDNGSDNGSRRWGDYSFTSLDPDDDMTMWTVQEYCNGTNTYGLRVARLSAPPPATPAGASGNAPLGSASVSITITGISVSGSGFFDPGPGFSNHISASVTGGVVVNSATYIDPTHVTLNLNTQSATGGAQNVTVTNPDGQSVTGNGILGTGSATPGPSPSPTATPFPSPLPSPTATPPTSSDPFGVISTPTAGSTLPGSTVTFTWTKGSATAYWLTVGDERATEPGGSNLFSSGQTGGNSVTVTNLPIDGRTIYVRLRSFVSGTWYNPPQDTQYTAQPAIVLTPLISPASKTYKKRVTVSMADGTPGTTIRYTLDGSVPTDASTLYQGSFTITTVGMTTVKAKAFKAGVLDSVPSVATYTVKKK